MATVHEIDPIPVQTGSNWILKTSSLLIYFVFQVYFMLIALNIGLIVNALVLFYRHSQTPYLHSFG